MNWSYASAETENATTATYARLLAAQTTKGRRLDAQVDGPLPTGGAEGTRTPDPHTASVVRYQLRHSPVRSDVRCGRSPYRLGVRALRRSAHRLAAQVMGPRCRPDERTEAGVVPLEPPAHR